MIKNYKIELDKENKIPENESNSDKARRESVESEEKVRNKTIRSSSVSQDVYETFLWLQNEKDSDSEIESRSNESLQERPDCKEDFHCIEIDDLKADECLFENN